MGEGGLSGPYGNVGSRILLRIAPTSSSMPAMFGIRCLSTPLCLKWQCGHRGPFPSVFASAMLAHSSPHDLDVLARWQYASGANTATNVDMSLNCHSHGLEKGLRSVLQMRISFFRQAMPLTPATCLTRQKVVAHASSLSSYHVIFGDRYHGPFNT